MSQKTIFTIYLSQDGIHTTAFTNVKALSKGLGEIKNDAYQTDYVPVSIDNKPYTYNKLLSSIRKSQDKNLMCVCRIKCENGAEILVQEVELKSNCL